ncbi:MAG: GHKL domain-containing protein [Candidatus Omnitrophica bacterium]|nr:GHKL domain-containing protein [Candidatus Omnitrophota bacterium]
MTTPRAEAIFRSDLQKVILRTDRMFFWLLIGQWLFGIAIALVWSPRTWIAQYWSIHQHVIAAAVLGALIMAYPLYLIIRRPSTPYTRHVIAVGQMLQSALLVHVTGGRIETHFHVFGSLALLAFYRDWPVLITASAVVYLDHLALGIWFPLSVYGVPAATIWRSVEHAFWVVFEVVFLVMACRKGVEELRALAERQVQVEEAKEALEAVQAQVVASERLAAIGQLAAGISHDLRTPLATMNNIAYFLKTKLQPQDQELADQVVLLTREIERMKAIANDILDFARPRPPVRTPLDMTRVLQEAVEMVTADAAGHRVRLTTRFGSGQAMVLGEHTQLLRAFANLLRNAVQATPADGQIIVTCARDEGRITTAVQDTGMGMDAETQAKLFQPLFTTKAQGIGLGLVNVKRIVEAHEGTIHVTSEPGHGSTFTVGLPSAPKEAMSHV